MEGNQAPGLGLAHMGHYKVPEETRLGHSACGELSQSKTLGVSGTV
jgi:hypothetical protein